MSGGAKRKTKDPLLGLLRVQTLAGFSIATDGLMIAIIKNLSTII
jgi:hypothetical protein